MTNSNILFWDVIPQARQKISVKQSARLYLESNLFSKVSKPRDTREAAGHHMYQNKSF